MSRVKTLAGLDIARGAQAAALDNGSLLLIARDELVGGAESAFEQACFRNHVRPIVRDSSRTCDQVLRGRCCR